MITFYFVSLKLGFLRLKYWIFKQKKFKSANFRNQNYNTMDPSSLKFYSRFKN